MRTSADGPKPVLQAEQENRTDRTDLAELNSKYPEGGRFLVSLCCVKESGNLFWHGDT